MGIKKFVLIDTAGMRRKSKIDEAVERYSIVRSLRSVDRSDIVVLVLDAQMVLPNKIRRLQVMLMKPVRV